MPRSGSRPTHERQKNWSRSAPPWHNRRDFGPIVLAVIYAPAWGGSSPGVPHSKGQLMRRILASALVLGIFSTVGLIGCGDEASVTKETEVSTPGGTTTTKTEKSVETTGDNPPPAATPGTTP